jgi:hypothetical protein
MIVTLYYILLMKTNDYIKNNMDKIESIHYTIISYIHIRFNNIKYELLFTPFCNSIFISIYILLIFGIIKFYII